MREHVKRNERGYRVGEDHHNAKASDAVVKRARDLYEFEFKKPLQIVGILKIEFGIDVCRSVVQQWVLYTSRNVTPREREERVPTHRTWR